MKLDITHRLGGRTVNNPSGGIEVKIDDQVVTSIADINLSLSADSSPEAIIRYACYDGVTFSGDVKAHHVCPLPSRIPTEGPSIAEIRKALKADIQTPLSYEGDSDEMEALHTLRQLARACLDLDTEELDDGH